MMNRNTPLVTVVTVCYNLYESKRVLQFQQCLKSVHSQDYSSVEHLVIDGASHDGTVEMLREYAGKGMIRLISEPDSGIYDAMNKGIHLAKGKYIAFLNSDDFWHRGDAVSASVAALEHSGAAFSYAPRSIVHEDGSFLCRESACLGGFPCHMPFCHQTMFTRREVLLSYGGFDAERFRSAADYDLILRLLLNGERGVYVPVNFTSFRLGGFSVQGEKLSLAECDRARRRLLGKRAARFLNRGEMDDDLLQSLMARVHPMVALDLLRCYKENAPGLYRMSHGLVRRYAAGDKGISCAPLCKSVTRWRLFHFLPVLKCKVRPTRTDFLLFDFLPLLRIRNKGNRQSYYLFLILPLLSRKQK